MSDGCVGFLEAKPHLSNVSYINRCAVHLADNDVFDIFHRPILSHGPDDVAALALIQIPGADVSIFPIQGPDHVLDSNISGSKGIWVHDHLHFLFPASVNVHGGHPGDPFQTRLHVVFDKFLLEEHIRGIPFDLLKHKPGDGIAFRPGSLDHGFFHIRGVLGHLVQFVGDLEQGGILIGSRLKLHDHASPAPEALALHLHQPFDTLELLLLLLYDFPLHLLGTGSWPYGLYLDLHLLNLRGELNGDPREGDETEQEDEKDSHRNGHGVLYGTVD